MQLHLESRPIGEVLVVQCIGRLVAGTEVFTVHSLVGDGIEKYGDVVLQLDRLDYVDSSGLGALIRLMQAARAKGGDLKLTGVPSRLQKMLDLTHLSSQFEIYESMEEAITAAYLGSRYSRGKTGDTRPRILCLYASLDMCTFLREILCAAGFNALTTTAVEDAPILLKATKAQLVIVSSRIQMLRGKPIRAVLQEIVPGIQLLALDDQFATLDPGEAAHKLLTDVNCVLSPANSPS